MCILLFYIIDCNKPGDRISIKLFNNFNRRSSMPNSPPSFLLILPSPIPFFILQFICYRPSDIESIKQPSFYGLIHF